MSHPPQSFEVHLERGDLSAAAEWLVRTHGRDVLHLCTALVRDRGTAEDLAQDVFSKAFTALPEFRGEASARTWLMTIARHRCLDHLRRHARQPWSLGRDEDLREPDYASDDQALLSDLLARQADLRTGLDALTESERAVVLLRFAHGLSFDEIAASFGLRSGTVRMRVGRALAKMRDAIEGGAGDVLMEEAARHVELTHMLARTASAELVPRLPSGALRARAKAPSVTPGAPPATASAASRSAPREPATSGATLAHRLGGLLSALSQGAAVDVDEAFVQRLLGRIPQR